MSEQTHDVFITLSMEVQVQVTGCATPEQALRVAKQNLEVVDYTRGVEVEFEDAEDDGTNPAAEFEVVGIHGWFEDVEGNSYAN